MDIEEMIKSGANIKVEIFPKDLERFGSAIATRAIEAVKALEKKEQECKYISADKVLEMLDISRTTLWQWDKKGITQPIRLGNLKRYRRSDIENIDTRKPI